MRNSLLRRPDTLHRGAGHRGAGHHGKSIIPLLIACLTFPALRPAHAAGVPAGFSDKEVASGFVSPSSMTALPDGRILVLQQDGVVRIIKNDVLLPASFHTIANADAFVERGCLGITADPNFAVNHYVYFYCTITDGRESFNRVLRVTEAADTAVTGSETVIFTLPNVPAGIKWHMGGGLVFGADGKLYVGVGGHEDDVVTPPEASFSQNIGSAFGKILRINPDGTIPADNPYVATPGAYPAAYALGLRNPYAMGVQPGTGLMLINEVGGGNWEEIDRALPRANYGWPGAEGNSSETTFTNPLFTYSHKVGCAITGGAFYNPPLQQFPATYAGKYFFSDFCNGTVRFIDPANPATANDFAAEIGNPVGVSVSPGGDLYYLARNEAAGETNTAAGTLGKISFPAPQPQGIATQP